MPDEIHEEEGFVSMTAGHTTVKVKKGTDGWDVSFSRDGKRLTGGGLALYLLYPGEQVPP